MINVTFYQSPLGKITLAGEEDSLIGLWLDGQNFNLESFSSEETPILSQTKNWLDRYFSGQKPSISELKMAPHGGVFRQTVWFFLQQIPYGQTTTYGEIAKKVAAHLGKEKMSAQAIGGAVGHNPISIIIPCHRVIGANGNLTGYGGGLGLKVKLLEHEKI